MTAVDGEVIGRMSLVVAGLIVTFFLFSLALSGPTLQLWRGMRGWIRGFARTTASAAILYRTASIRRLLGP